jgi:outer membrane lipoprotein-sorting protein
MKQRPEVYSVYLSLIFSLGISAACLGSALPAAREIVRKGQDQMRGASVQALMTMKIVRPSFERELQLRVWTLESKNALVEILKPAKEQGVTSLRAADQMWNFLPKTDQIVRVPTSLMLQSWMGSDFTNDDLMKMSSVADDYSHRLVKNEKRDGHESVLIECTPKRAAAVVWGKILYWARRSDSLPVRQEYYDEKGTLIRTLTLSEFKKMDDRVIPTSLRIEKANGSGEQTTITYQRILFDRPMEDALFTRDGLKNTSKKGLDLSSGWLTQLTRRGSEGA